jgi:hypothetical protein
MTLPMRENVYKIKRRHYFNCVVNCCDGTFFAFTTNANTYE